MEKRHVDRRRFLAALGAAGAGAIAGCTDDEAPTDFENGAIEDDAGTETRVATETEFADDTTMGTESAAPTGTEFDAGTPSGTRIETPAETDVGPRRPTRTTPLAPTSQDFSLRLSYTEGVPGPSSFEFIHEPSSTREVRVEHLEVELRKTNADGVYPLGLVTDSTVSRPGDSYTFTGETVGADPLMDDAEYSIYLYYTRNERLRVAGVKAEPIATPTPR